VKFIGRAGNSIPGSAGAVIGLVAALALWLDMPRRFSPGALVLTGASLVSLAGLVLSGSRGPMLAFGATPIALLLMWRRASAVWLIALGFTAWLALTLLVVAETSIPKELCHLTSLACRASHRHEVWTESLRLISDHPWLGVGPGFRFTGFVVHPHNGFIGTAALYGLPVCAAFITFLFAAAQAIARTDDLVTRLFAGGMFCFAFGYMGSDLPDPFRFIGMHYLFLWLPIGLAFAARSLAAPDCARRRSVPSSSGPTSQQQMAPN
jgi:O-antigen ligase